MLSSLQRLLHRFVQRKHASIPLQVREVRVQITFLEMTESLEIIDHDSGHIVVRELLVAVKPSKPGVFPDTDYVAAVPPPRPAPCVNGNRKCPICGNPKCPTCEEGVGAERTLSMANRVVEPLSRLFHMAEAWGVAPEGTRADS